MADKKISELDVAGALTGIEPVPIVQAGETVRTTTQDIADLASPASSISVLSADTTFYVSTTGSDSNDGLTALTAFLTIQHAVNVVLATFLNDFVATISVADGTYVEQVIIGNPLVGGSAVITGNTTTPDNVVIKPNVAPSGTLGVDNLAVLSIHNSSGWTVRGFKLDGTDAGWNGWQCLEVVSSQSVHLSDLNFELPTDDGWFTIYMQNAPGIFFTGPMTITQPGFQDSIISVSDQVAFRMSGAFTLSGSAIVWSSGAIAMRNLCICNVRPGSTFSGSATGPRVKLTAESTISDLTSSTADTFFPGDSINIDATSSYSPTINGSMGTNSISNPPTTTATGVVVSNTAAVVRVSGTGGSPALYINQGGTSVNALTENCRSVATQFDKTSNTTLADITDLVVKVAAGNTYRFVATLFTTSNVAGGVQAAIAGTATATSIIYEGQTTDANAIAGQTRATALASAVAAVTAVTAARIDIWGTIKVNAAGTLTVQFAQNASNGTASSVLVGSTFTVKEIV